MKRFKREIITLIVIVAIILGIDLVTDKIMKDTTKEINKIIEEIEKEIESDEKISGMIDDLRNVWTEKETMLAYFAEHDELEKVTIEVTELKSNMENDMKEEVKKNIEKVKFLLKHIDEKGKVKFKNIL